MLAAAAAGKSKFRRGVAAVAAGAPSGPSAAAAAEEEDVYDPIEGPPDTSCRIRHSDACLKIVQIRRRGSPPYPLFQLKLVSPSSLSLSDISRVPHLFSSTFLRQSRPQAPGSVPGQPHRRARGVQGHQQGRFPGCGWAAAPGHASTRL